MDKNDEDPVQDTRFEDESDLEMFELRLDEPNLDFEEFVRSLEAAEEAS